ncbi:hypothetical protein [Filimonas effusa]|uniref:Anti-sigma factor n=1 Tax=Filimonas effusa TaxID=2508721 RepID=A0A4V1M9P5_9BACT|nr:hypothetical protein [Filimonas effusa]RXK81930.1 hypothetical protein ESB13_19300 [Filimonas effusa]
MQTCTTDDLLLYLYGDLSVPDRLLTEEILQENWGLREKLNVMQEATDTLDSVKIKSPSQRSIQAILTYLYDRNSSAILTETAADLK